MPISLTKVALPNSDDSDLEEKGKESGMDVDVGASASEVPSGVAPYPAGYSGYTSQDVPMELAGSAGNPGGSWEFFPEHYPVLHHAGKYSNICDVMYCHLDKAMALNPHPLSYVTVDNARTCSLNKVASTHRQQKVSKAVAIKTAEVIAKAE